MNFTIIAAIDKNNGIGKNNALPWRLKADMDHFSQTTTQAATDKTNVVIMGTNTWRSLPEKYRPLPNRLNIVLSPEPIELPDNVKTFTTLETALAWLDTQNNIGKTFIIGGASLYAYAINLPACEYLDLTEIDNEFACDTFFPTIPAWYKKIFSSETHTENEITFRFCHYQAFEELRQTETPN